MHTAAELARESKVNEGTFYRILLRGVLADPAHVLERAHERGFLGGELEARRCSLATSSGRYPPVAGRI